MTDDALATLPRRRALTWRSRCGREVPLSRQDLHQLGPAAFDVLAFNLSAELVFTNVLNCIDLAGSPVRTADRTDIDPIVVAGGHCAFNPEPLSDFGRRVRIGDGEEVVADITTAVGAPPPATELNCSARLARVPGCLMTPALYDVPTTAPRSWRVTPKFDATCRRCRAAHDHRPRSVAVPEATTGPLTEVVHDRAQRRRSFRGCTRGVPLLPGRMITPPGP